MAIFRFNMVTPRRNTMRMETKPDVKARHHAVNWLGFAYKTLTHIAFRSSIYYAALIHTSYIRPKPHAVSHRACKGRLRSLPRRRRFGSAAPCIPLLASPRRKASERASAPLYILIDSKIAGFCEKVTISNRVININITTFCKFAAKNQGRFYKLACDVYATIVP